ncbi:MAG: DUF4159 domain-containing protein [Gammaproteobacteria bacterium]
MRIGFTRALLLCASFAALFAIDGDAIAQREFRVYQSFEGYDGYASLPPDYDVPAEFVVGRLMYPSRGFGSRFGRIWERGGTHWAVDYPKGDRTLAELLRRFTRADVRSVEQPVNLDDGDDPYYWPFMLVGLAGNWDLTDAQAAKLREYLLRGGFLYFDSFFGSDQWWGFEEGMRRVFPDRPIVDLDDDHPVFHIVYDIPNGTKIQIPHMGSLLWGGPGYLGDGAVPRWRGIFDDDGRLMVLIGFNNDTPDSWQWADDPRYPAEAANLGLRLGVNFVVYALTH